MRTFDPGSATTRAFTNRKAVIRAAALAGAFRLWDSIVSGPGDQQAETWVNAWAPLRAAGAAQTAVLTDAFVTQFLGAAGVVPADDTPIDVNEILGLVRPGVTDTEIAMRPIKEIRRALSNGQPLGDAIAQGRRRLEVIEATDMQQASRLAFAARATREPAVRSYRRILTGGESCALCVIATTRRYRTDQLMPIHPGCDCGVEPIVGTSGGSVIDRDTLDQVDELLKNNGYGSGTSTERAELANFKIRLNASSADDVVTVNHGELGPMLAAGHHRSVDRGDLPSWVRGPRREFDQDNLLTRGPGSDREQRANRTAGRGAEPGALQDLMAELADDLRQAAGT